MESRLIVMKQSFRSATKVAILNFARLMMIIMMNPLRRNVFFHAYTSLISGVQTVAALALKSEGANLGIPCKNRWLDQFKTNNK